MENIINEILKVVPQGKVSDAVFEGANIVLYTKDKDFFLNNEGYIKKAVDTIKKRVELRCDPSMCMQEEKAREIIKAIMPDEAKADNILFDSKRSLVIIESEKPGIAIGKQGNLLHEIREKTMWVPIIRRTPAIRSEIIESIRGVLYQNSDERRKFLNEVGHRIYDGWIRGKKEEWVRVTYLGSGRQVGRSCIFLQTPESRVLLDLGIDPANDQDPYPHLEAPEFKLSELDAVVISHAHLDHTGFLPYLFRLGYRGPVYCTPPTRDIMSLLQLDLVKIQRNEGKEPIYTSEEIKETVKHTITLDYEEVTDITPDIRITFYNAGHILGSAMVHIHIGNGLHNLVYSADIKYGRTKLLDPTITKFPRVETLMIESTYGGKDNTPPSRESDEERVANIIINTLNRGGKVLVPTLGVGRSQEIMVIVEELVRKGILPAETKVFLDGMVWDIMAIHTAYPEYLNKNVRNQIFHKDENPFLHPIFHRIGSQKERMQLIEETGPCVIIATSGMMTGGPSVEYFKHLADNPKNSLIFVSYQGEGSLGRRVQRGEKEILFRNGQKQQVVVVNMELHTIESFTGHSTRKELMNYVYKIMPKPKKIIMNHGEASRCLDFASSVHKVYRIETAAPRNLETIRLR